MHIIHLTYPIGEKLFPTNIILALGFFDGVHLGHQQLIKIAKKKGRQQALALGCNDL